MIRHKSPAHCLKSALIPAALLAALPVAAAADTLVCTATQQCRGDAQRMCAPSALSIRVERRGTGAQLWIDRQGPYAASLMGAALVVDAFGPAYRLTVTPDGGFTYTGNRGKRFTGTCKEAA